MGFGVAASSRSSRRLGARPVPRHRVRDGRRGDRARAIDTFGPSGDIAYLHLRDVKGTVPAFHECFIGEGNYDPAEVMPAPPRGWASMAS